MNPLVLIHERPIIWAHRGGRDLAAENTLGAARAAAAAGADGWELDVQPTRDGEIIVLHDLNLLRSTNAGAHPLFKGNKPIVPWRFSLAEIKTLSAGAFPRRACPPRSAARPWLEVPASVPQDERVPTLAEALALSAELGLWVNIEIKDLSHDVPEYLARTVVWKVHNLVNAAGMRDMVVISSFDHDTIQESKERAPDILTGALTPHSFTDDPVEMARAARADAWHPGFRGLTRESVARAREAGLAINPYTVNDPADKARLTEWGVTGLVTDRP